MGLTITKKIGSAPVRVSLRRKYREIFRLHQHEIRSDVLMVFQAKNGSPKATYHELETDILGQLKEAGIFGKLV